MEKGSIASDEAGGGILTALRGRQRCSQSLRPAVRSISFLFSISLFLHRKKYVRITMRGFENGQQRDYYYYQSST